MSHKVKVCRNFRVQFTSRDLEVKISVYVVNIYIPIYGVCGFKKTLFDRITVTNTKLLLIYLIKIGRTINFRGVQKIIVPLKTDITQLYIS